jgi:hypothetical protein
MPRETGGLHCREHLEHPLGGPGSTLLEATTEEVLSHFLPDLPSYEGLPRETGGLHCRGHIEHPLGDPGSTLLEAGSLGAVNQETKQPCTGRPGSGGAGIVGLSVMLKARVVGSMD